MKTIRDALLARSEDDRPALLSGEDRWSWREYVDQCSRRASVLADVLDPERPPHVGLLMDNTPEMAFQLGAAGLGAHVAVGLNTTRRGEALLADIRKADCQVVVADPRLLPLLDGIDLDGVRLERSDDPGWQERVRGCVRRPARRRTRARLAVHADLHLGHQRRPEGGADHPRQGDGSRAPTWPSGSGWAATTCCTRRCRCSTPTR